MYYVEVLGKSYTLYLVPEDDTNMRDCDGYCDTSDKSIAIADLKPGRGVKKNLLDYKKQVLRHEIIHAYLYESGLGSESWGANEAIVDWIALQFHKLERSINSAERNLAETIGEKESTE